MLVTDHISRKRQQSRQNDQDHHVHRQPTLQDWKIWSKGFHAMCHFHVACDRWGAFMELEQGLTGQEYNSFALETIFFGLACVNWTRKRTRWSKIHQIQACNSNKLLLQSHCWPDVWAKDRFYQSKFAAWARKEWQQEPIFLRFNLTNRSLGWLWKALMGKSLNYFFFPATVLALPTQDIMWSHTSDNQIDIASRHMTVGPKLLFLHMHWLLCENFLS